MSVLSSYFILLVYSRWELIDICEVRQKIAIHMLRTLEVPVSNLALEDRLYLTRFSVVSPSPPPPQINAGILQQIFHDRFLPHPFQFIFNPTLQRHITYKVLKL
jgi:hypothetical protein